MPEYQWIEKMKNIAKRNIFGFMSFRSGLNLQFFLVAPLIPEGCPRFYTPDIRGQISPQGSRVGRR